MEPIGSLSDRQEFSLFGLLSVAPCRKLAQVEQTMVTANQRCWWFLDETNSRHADVGSSENVTEVVQKLGFIEDSFVGKLLPVVNRFKFFDLRLDVSLEIS